MFGVTATSCTRPTASCTAPTVTAVNHIAHIITPVLDLDVTVRDVIGMTTTLNLSSPMAVLVDTLAVTDTICNTV